MDRYLGAFSYAKAIFVHYMTLTNETVLFAFAAGVLAFSTGLAMIFFERVRKNLAVLGVLIFLPIVISVFGTALTIRDVNEAISLEKQHELESSAEKYYDLEYGYSKGLLIFFCLGAGIASAIPAIIVFIILIFTRRKGELIE